MCGSTASRAMKRCWISLVPSKMRLMRMSRMMRSTGYAFSPRSRSDRAVSYPRPPRICTRWSMHCHATSVLNSFAIAASSRRSTLPRSARPDVSHTIASIANVCDRLVLSDRRAPLHALVRPLLRDLEHAACARGAPGWNREASRVQRDERELEPEPFAPQQVLFRNVDVFEVDQHIADAAQAHELAAMRDLDAGRVRLHDERGDLLLLFSVDDFRRRLRHDHDDFCLQSVRAPQLLTVEDPALAVGSRYRARLHLRGIGSDARLGERERGDRAFRESRQIFFLLLFGAEQFQRLRHADRLMRGEPRDGRSTPCCDEADRAVVVGRGESETAVFFRDLHSPGADLVETVEE